MSIITRTACGGDAAAGAGAAEDPRIDACSLVARVANTRPAEGELIVRPESSRVGARLLVAGVTVLVLVAVLAPTAGQARVVMPDAVAAPAARCKAAAVNGRRVCLRVGQRCRMSHNPDYQAGFECRRRGRQVVLRRAGEAALRRGRSLALGPSGLPTFTQALAAFDQVVADLPGVSPASGIVGPATSGTVVIAWLSRFNDSLTRAQQAVLQSVVSPHADAVRVTEPDPVPGELESLVRASIPEPILTPRHAAARAAQADPVLGEFESITREAVPRLRAKG